MKSAPDFALLGTLVAFSFLNARAMPKPDRVRYDAQGFNVRFIPRTGAFSPDFPPRDAVAAVRPEPAVRAAVTPASFAGAMGAPGEPLSQSSAVAALEQKKLSRAPQDLDESVGSEASRASVQAATKGVEEGKAYFAQGDRPAPLITASEKEATAAAPKLREGQIKAAGAEPGFLRSLWPVTVRVLLNSKTFNDSLYENPWSKKACEDPAFLRSYLADGKNPDGVKRELGLVIKLMEDPNAARAAAGTKFAQRILDCPAVQKLSRDREAVASLAKDNPALLKALASPVGLEILAADPKAAPLFKEVQKGLEKANLTGKDG